MSSVLVLYKSHLIVIFLGLIGCYHWFIKDYGKIARSLTLKGWHKDPKIDKTGDVWKSQLWRESGRNPHQLCRQTLKRKKE